MIQFQSYFATVTLINHERNFTISHHLKFNQLVNADSIKAIIQGPDRIE